MSAFSNVRGVRALRWILIVAGIVLPLAGCIVPTWWGLEISGDDGRVRTDGGLYEIPGKLTYDPYPGTGSYHPEGRDVILAAVPDCGYAFDAWRVPDWGMSFADPILRVSLPEWSFRVVEVSFVQSGVESNDCFATPQELTEIGLSGSVDVVNLFAGMEAGEPDLSRPLCERHGYDPAECDRAGASLWWTFRAPAPGRLRLEARDVALAVFTGASLSELTAVVEAADSSDMPVDVPVVEGDVMRIMLDGWTTWAGWQPSGEIAHGETTSDGVLSWEFLPTADALESPTR